MTLTAHGAFGPTRWTLVLRARGATPDARAALCELCDAYYQPVFRFLQRERRNDAAARELTQEFFARILQRGEIGEPNPTRGRFRSYLLGAVKHFLADQRKYGRRNKRGGEAIHESLNEAADDAARVLQVADPGATPPDAWFDRLWALTVMDRALRTVEGEFRSAGRGEQFDQLKPWLMGEVTGLSHAEAARQLRMSEGAVKVAIHRLRQRFRDRIRAEVIQTLAAGDEVDAELRYLVEVLNHE